jgi:predicted transcriptional regulator
MLFDIKKKKIEQTYLKKAHFFSFYSWAVEFFKKIQEEGELVKSWIKHLHDKTERLESMHHNHRDEVKRDIKEVQEWIYNAYELNKNTRKDLEKTQELIKILYQQHKDTLEILNDLKQENKRLKETITNFVSQSVTRVSHSDTDSVTKSVTVTQKNDFSTKNREKTQGDIGKNSDTRVSQAVTQMTRSDTDDTEMTQKSIRKTEISKSTAHKRIDKRNHEEAGVIAKLGEINMSEKRVLYLLIHSQKEMTYQTISEKLDMNYSTVKNIIYRLRKRGFPVKDMVTKRGEKAFYLPENLKIALKTRE